MSFIKLSVNSILAALLLIALCLQAGPGLASEIKQGVIYPIYQQFTPLELIACRNKAVIRSKFNLENGQGLGVEVSTNDGDDLDLCYGLELFQYEAYSYSYRTLQDISIKDTKPTCLFGVINPFLRWRKRMNNDLWFFSFELGMPFLSTNSKEINELINFRTPGLIGISLGLPLWTNSYLDIGWRKLIYDAETQHIAAAPEPDRDYQSTYEMNSFIVSIKVFLDITDR